MKNKTNDRIYHGDTILTSEAFVPTDNKGVPIDLENFSHIGMVVILKCGKKREQYGIRFSKHLDFTNSLNGKLRDNSGYYLDREDFDLYEE